MSADSIESKSINKIWWRILFPIGLITDRATLFPSALTGQRTTHCLQVISTTCIISFLWSWSVVSLMVVHEWNRAISANNMFV